MSNSGGAAQAAWLALAPVSVRGVSSEHCTKAASQFLYSMAGQFQMRRYTGEVELLLKAVQLPC